MANPPGPLIRLLLPAQTPTPATLALLPEAEQASVQRYFRAPDRALSLSSALLKHLAIARLCHVPWSATHLRKEEWGKPYYDPPAGATRGAEFNVSHHGLVVVLAGAGHAVGAGGKAGDGPRRVGIDVARVDVSGTAKTVAERGSWESWTQIWADVFSAAEMVEIAGAGGTLEARLRGFYARWALKEAYLKVSGQGLGAPWVKEVEFRAVRVPGKGAGEWGWGEVVRDVQVWVRGVRSTEVALELQGLGGGYIVATAVQGGHGGEPFPPFEEVSVERDVFPLANGAWDSPAVVEDSKGLRDLKPASAKPSFMTVGVLALQGAFHEHIQLLQQASSSVPDVTWKFTEVRNTVDLSSCDALVIPGGESTAISLVAERSGLLEPLRDFVK
jgi:4'-phosphopantetheinyl transferase